MGRFESEVAYYESNLTTMSVEVVKQGLLDALKLGNRLAGHALKGRFELTTEEIQEVDQAMDDLGNLHRIVEVRGNLDWSGRVLHQAAAELGSLQAIRWEVQRFQSMRWPDHAEAWLVDLSAKGVSVATRELSSMYESLGRFEDARAALYRSVAQGWAAADSP
jgi:hypothetical protein